MLFGTHIYSKDLVDDTYVEIVGPWIVAASFAEAQTYCDMFLEEYVNTKDMLYIFAYDVHPIPFQHCLN